MKDVQERLVGSPEKSWRRGGGDELLLLELRAEVDLFKRDSLCLDLPRSALVCPDASVCPVCAACCAILLS